MAEPTTRTVQFNQDELAATALIVSLYADGRLRGGTIGYDQDFMTELSRKWCYLTGITKIHSLNTAGKTPEEIQDEINRLAAEAVAAAEAKQAHQ